MRTIFDPPNKPAVIFVDLPTWYDEMTRAFYAARQFGNDCLKRTVQSWARREIDPFNAARSLTLRRVYESSVNPDLYQDITHDFVPSRQGLLTDSDSGVRYDGLGVIQVVRGEGAERTVIDVYLGDISKFESECFT